jgi:hypothetical protein
VLLLKLLSFNASFHMSQLKGLRSARRSVSSLQSCWQPKSSFQILDILIKIFLFVANFEAKYVKVNLVFQYGSWGGFKLSPVPFRLTGFRVKLKKCPVQAHVMTSKYPDDDK